MVPAAARRHRRSSSRREPVKPMTTAQSEWRGAGSRRSGPASGGAAGAAGSRGQVLPANAAAASAGWRARGAGSGAAAGGAAGPVAAASAAGGLAMLVESPVTSAGRSERFWRWGPFAARPAALHARCGLDAMTLLTRFRCGGLAPMRLRRQWQVLQEQHACQPRLGRAHDRRRQVSARVDATRSARLLRGRGGSRAPADGRAHTQPPPKTPTRTRRGYCFDSDGAPRRAPLAYNQTLACARATPNSHAAPPASRDARPTRSTHAAALTVLQQDM